MSNSIWLICKYASPGKYFFGTRHFYLAEEWIKNGYQVAIFTSNSSHLSDKLPDFIGDRMVEDINGIKTVWLNVIKSNNSSSMRRVLSWIHFELKVIFTSKKMFPKPDVIIVSSLSILSIISGFILSRFYKSRFILEIRDIWPLSAMHLGGYKSTHPFMWLLSKIERFGYRNADVIVGTMPNLIEHVKNVEPKFKECICIPQGIKKGQLDEFQPLSREFIDKTFTPGTFKIVYAGTVNSNNPIHVLLQAITQIPEDQKIEAYILGSGSMLGNYKNLYANCKQIKFISPIAKIQVKAFLQQTDLCFDSIDSEIAKFGLSRNKWIDYMNAEKPIICSYSGYQSMINEANSGTFVPFGRVDLLVNEILRYKNMPIEERIELGKRSKNYLITNRLFEKLAKDYELLFS